MKKGQVLALGVAGLLGLGAMAGVWSILDRKPEVQTQEVKVDTTQVLVAKQEIGLGQIVAPDNFRWQDWPKGAISPGYIQKNGKGDAIKDMAGRVARAPLLANEPVTPHKLVKAGEGGVLAAILPAGMRAVSTRIKEETAAGKLILPNDHVDVLLIQRQRGRAGSDGFVVDTLFRNVRVLAIGQLIEAKEGKKGADGATATLEMTPRQSELLALANSMGEISLALRSVADIDPNGGPTNKADPFGQRGNAIRMVRYGVKSRVYGVN